MGSALTPSKLNVLVPHLHRAAGLSARRRRSSRNFCKFIRLIRRAFLSGNGQQEDGLMVASAKVRTKNAPPQSKTKLFAGTVVRKPSTGCYMSPIQLGDEINAPSTGAPRSRNRCISAIHCSSLG